MFHLPRASAKLSPSPGMVAMQEEEGRRMKLSFLWRYLAFGVYITTL